MSKYITFKDLSLLVFQIVNQNLSPKLSLAWQFLHSQLGRIEVITFSPQVFINLYFLVVAISQLIPSLRVTYVYTSWAPLIFVIFVTMCREAFDDCKVCYIRLTFMLTYLLYHMSRYLF